MVYAIGVAARDPRRSGRFRRPGSRHGLAETPHSPGRRRPRASSDWPHQVRARIWRERSDRVQLRGGTVRVAVSSFSYDTGRPPAADLIVDCRHLANPHQVPGLRPRDGTQSPVRDWVLAQPGTVEMLDEVLDEARRVEAQSIAVGCSAGRHRSVVVADALASRLGTAAQHLSLETQAARRSGGKRSTSTTGRGLGWKHQQEVERLRRRHVDGTACWWCARPMHKSAAKNFDSATLEGDHSEARSRGGRKADRLLHSTCNRQRGDGARDHLRPALTGVWSPPGGAADVPDPAALTGPPEPRAEVLTWG